jgi:hypothetical protein
MAGCKSLWESEQLTAGLGELRRSLKNLGIRRERIHMERFAHP